MRLVTLFITIPLMAVGAAFAVANRGPVTIAFDPFSREPAVALTMPVWAAVFAGIAIGIVLGSAFARAGLARLRRAIREERRRADALQQTIAMRRPAPETAATAKPGTAEALQRA